MQAWARFWRIDFDGNRTYGLDILRAVSILCVVLAHGNNLLSLKFNPLYYFIFDGVSVFFVLSGFLIGRILIGILEQQGASLKTLSNFYLRRWFRTLPNYYLILLILAIGWYIFVDLKPRDIYPYFFFSQNLFTPHYRFFPEAWSLPVEEWFYLLVPAILFFCVGILRVSVKKTVLATAVTIILLTIAFRYFRYQDLPALDLRGWDLLFRKQVVTRMDGLMFGVLGAYAARYYAGQWVKYRKIMFFLGFVILVATQITFVTGRFGYGLYGSVFSFTTYAIGVLLLLPFLSEYRLGSGRIHKITTTISIVSYSMYLVHLSLVQVFMLAPLRFMGLDKTQYMLVAYPLYWLLTVTISILLYKYFEKPFMNLREKVTEHETQKAELSIQ
jgi:peptidoglycan/LPS O-acetylase OafA/YrhL